MNEKNFCYIGYIDSGIICWREDHLQGIKEVLDSFLKEGEEYYFRANYLDECPSPGGGAHYGREIWVLMEKDRAMEFRELIKRIDEGGA